MTFKIELPRTIDGNLAADIEKESAFVSPFLTELRVAPKRNAVELAIADEERWLEVEAKVKRFLDSMLRRVHNFETVVFHENRRRDDGPIVDGVQEILRQRKWIFDYGGGQVALAGPALVLARLIDARAAEMYKNEFRAVSSMFPAFVSADLLARCGYFDSHPNAASFVGHMIEDFDAIEAFRQANSSARDVKMPAMEHVKFPGTCLNPAACFPCYPTLEGETIGPEGRAFTWLGRVFRYESRNAGGLERLWEFNVRELVFAGTQDFVGDCRQRALSVIGELASEFDLECRIESATDAFFASVSAAKTFWQQAQEAKNEIMMPIEPGRDGAERRIACGSINLHSNFFGDRFSFSTGEGTAAHSGCVGLGIERWVLAAFSQHGLDPQRWPAALRTEVFG